MCFTTELGEPCDPRNALRALKTAAKWAGLPSSIGLHTLRHSAASVMLSAGVPLKVVTEVFGHASVAITGGIFGHVSPDVSREALTRLSDALSRKGGRKRWPHHQQVVDEAHNCDPAA
jgi:site-specific recombinase XerD